MSTTLLPWTRAAVWVSMCTILASGTSPDTDGWTYKLLPFYTNNPRKGFLQITTTDKEAMYVCAQAQYDTMGVNEAATLCRTLGMPYAGASGFTAGASAIRNASGLGFNPVHSITDLNCGASASVLGDCQFKFSTTDCDSSLAMAVTCGPDVVVDFTAIANKSYAFDEISFQWTISAQVNNLWSSRIKYTGVLKEDANYVYRNFTIIDPLDFNDFGTGTGQLQSGYDAAVALVSSGSLATLAGEGIVEMRSSLDTYTPFPSSPPSSSNWGYALSLAGTMFDTVPYKVANPNFGRLALTIGNNPSGVMSSASVTDATALHLCHSLAADGGAVTILGRLIPHFWEPPKLTTPIYASGLVCTGPKACTGIINDAFTKMNTATHKSDAGLFCGRNVWPKGVEPLYSVASHTLQVVTIVPSDPVLLSTYIPRILNVPASRFTFLSSTTRGAGFMTMYTYDFAISDSEKGITAQDVFIIAMVTSRWAVSEEILGFLLFDRGFAPPPSTKPSMVVVEFMLNASASTNTTFIRNAAADAARVDRSTVAVVDCPSGGQQANSVCLSFSSQAAAKSASDAANKGQLSRLGVTGAGAPNEASAEDSSDDTTIIIIVVVVVAVVVIAIIVGVVVMVQKSHRTGEQETKSGAHENLVQLQEMEAGEHASTKVNHYDL